MSRALHRGYRWARTAGAIAPGTAAAERFVELDPYVSNGLIERWEVRPWTTVVGKDAAHPV